MRWWIALGASIGILAAAALPTFHAEPLEFTLAVGSSAAATARLLKERKIIRSESLFLLLSKLKGSQRRFQAGTYKVTGIVSYWDAIETVEGKRGTLDRLITLPEGLRSDEMAQLLEHEGVVGALQFIAIVRHPPQALDDRFPFLRVRPRDQGLEGFLYPDTYRFRLNEDPQAVAARLLENFNNKIVLPFYGSSPPDDFYAKLTLASIIEREVANALDRRMVADVFLKRLKSGIPLQADSTINYITGRSDRSARSEDLLIASSYNTYRMRGLPPGPIANPSEDAFQAVTEPKPNPYYYFLTDRQGVVYYARTFDEHQTNRLQHLTQ